MVEKVQLPTACWNIPHKCLKEREFEPGCEDLQIIFFCSMKQKKGRCQRNTSAPCYSLKSCTESHSSSHDENIELKICRFLVLDAKQVGDIRTIKFQETSWGNAQKAFRHFSVLKSSSCQPLGEAIVHLEKDKPDCDGWLSIKLAM